MKDSDLLIVVGCDFKTAKFIPDTFLHREPPVPIIEINERSVINVGYTNQIKSSPEDVLPQLFNAYYKEIKTDGNPS